MWSDGDAPSVSVLSWPCVQLGGWLRLCSDDGSGSVIDSGVAVRRRRRSVEERRLIVEEMLEPGCSLSRVARKYGINANQVFQWRRLYQDGALGGLPSSELRLLPVSVVENAAPAKLVKARGGRQVRFT